MWRVERVAECTRVGLDQENYSYLSIVAYWAAIKAKPDHHHAINGLATWFKDPVCATCPAANHPGPDFSELAIAININYTSRTALGRAHKHCFRTLAEKPPYYTLWIILANTTHLHSLHIRIVHWNSSSIIDHTNTLCVPTHIAQFTSPLISPTLLYSDHPWSLTM